MLIFLEKKKTTYEVPSKIQLKDLNGKQIIMFNSYHVGSRYRPLKQHRRTCYLTQMPAEYCHQTRNLRIQIKICA